MEAHCIALELKYQNQALKLGQHGQILNETSNKAKIEKEIDVLEIMNIELEHSVAKLRKENETLKQHYKDLEKTQIQGKGGFLQESYSTLVQARLTVNPHKVQNVDIPHIHECKQTLDSMVAEKADISETIVNVDSQMMIQKNDSLTTDASNKRQQQPDSTSSTSTLATTVTANGNLDLSYALSWKPCQGDSLNLPDHRYSIYTIKWETEGLDDGVAASFQRSRIHKPHAHTHAFKVNRSTSRSLILNFPTIKEPQTQVDQGSQIKMIQVKEMMQDNDLKNSKSKDKGSRSRSQSMNEQSHYKQDKTKTRQSINVKSHIFNVRGDNDKTKQTPTRMSSVVQRSLKKETSTLGEIVSLNNIKSNKNVIGLIKSNWVLLSNRLVGFNGLGL
ncbi:hypothetical protein Tco_0552237 [Tanacetum coccineum]